MSGGAYEPKDSRDVTGVKAEAGKPTRWREKEAPTRGAMEPADSRAVTGVPDAGAGEPIGWRDGDEAAGRADDAPPPDPAARPPRGVPQDSAPFSAEEAADAANKSG